VNYTVTLRDADFLLLILKLVGSYSTTKSKAIRFDLFFKLNKCRVKLDIIEILIF
jgi:hypothetical protein